MKNPKELAGSCLAVNWTLLRKMVVFPATGQRAGVARDSVAAARPNLATDSRPSVLSERWEEGEKGEEGSEEGQLGKERARGSEKGGEPEGPPPPRSATSCKNKAESLRLGTG